MPGVDEPQAFNTGVWFQAGCSGLWYTNHKAAGSISQVRIDGENYYSDKKDINEDESEDHYQEMMGSS